MVFSWLLKHAWPTVTGSTTKLIINYRSRFTSTSLQYTDLHYKQYCSALKSILSKSRVVQNVVVVVCLFVCFLLILHTAYCRKRREGNITQVKVLSENKIWCLCCEWTSFTKNWDAVYRSRYICWKRICKRWTPIYKLKIRQIQHIRC